MFINLKNSKNKKKYKNGLGVLVIYLIVGCLLLSNLAVVLVVCTRIMCWFCGWDSPL